jgi:DNA-binding CsgD family transcriptional regulator
MPPIRRDLSNAHHDSPHEGWESTSFVSPENAGASFATEDLSELIEPEVHSAALPLAASVHAFLSDTRVSGTDTAAMPRDVLLALTYGLELVRCGAMLVHFEGHPYFANRAAVDILKKGDGIALARTGLVADRPSDTGLLQQLLRDAITSPEMGEPKGSPITLPRKLARTSLVVRVLPGPGLDCWPDEENRAALLTFYDEDQTLEIDEAVLRQLYGLTRGEAALATILLRGKSIEDAAAELFISPHTARTHLKRIFMKTDTHRQTELVVRMFSAIL